MVWDGGGAAYSMATAGLGTWTLSPELLPGFDNLPGVLSATSKQHGIGGVARETGQNSRAGPPWLESGDETEDGFMGFCKSP